MYILGGLFVWWFAKWNYKLYQIGKTEKLKRDDEAWHWWRYQQIRFVSSAIIGVFLGLFMIVYGLIGMFDEEFFH